MNRCARSCASWAKPEARNTEANEMKDRLPAAFAIGVVFVAVAVGAILFMQRNAAVGITGIVLKVRTAPLDEKSAVAVVDFRFTNPSDVNFVVGSVTVTMEDQK